MSRGEVVLADLGGGPLCPVLILQNEAAEIVGTTIVVPLTVHFPESVGATKVLIDVGDGPLPTRHVANCAQLRVLPVNRLKDTLGPVRIDKLREIESVVSFRLGLP